jgi:quercetin dioxygenase-like cupin family protein
MNSDVEVIGLDALEWDEQVAGIRLKTVVAADGSTWNRVTYRPGAVRDDVWCEKGHRGFVLEGAMSYEYQDGETFTISAGDGFIVSPGRAHRGHNVSDAQATFLMIDDAPEMEFGR